MFVRGFAPMVCRRSRDYRQDNPQPSSPMGIETILFIGGVIVLIVAWSLTRKARRARRGDDTPPQPTSGA